MLHPNHAVWGIVLVVLLVAFLFVKRFIRRRSAVGNALLNGLSADRELNLHELEHRALMFLVNQKMDAVLAAMGHTIDEERQKLGAAVMNPSSEDDAPMPAAATPERENATPPYARAVAMHREGLSVAVIARQLQLPEAEVALVTRLNAA